MNPRVCVIGAGCSGITAVKNLIQAGVRDIVCYEKGSAIGGNWRYSDQEGHSSVCETTHIISSKTMSAYTDFPMPDDYPDYPSHAQVLAYFERYAAHFGLTPYIQFNTAVTHAQLLGDDTWQLTLSNGNVEKFDFLLVANGHHSVPRLPKFPGTFEGDLIHSHAYKNNRDEKYQGKRVLVIGAGNSGCDCAVEISRVAERVDISMRRGYYIIPKFFMGKPIDAYNNTFHKLPRFILNPIQRFTLKFQVGDYRSYGMKKPDYPITKSHPVLNSELLYKIRHGKIHPRGDISHFEGNSVLYKDGKRVNYDTVIAATGYKIIFPFFDKEFIDYSEADRVPLYLRTFHPQHKSLFFIGLVQPQGCVWPLSDLQAQLVSNHIMGRWERPANIAELAEKDSDHIDKEFLKAARHTIEVHYHDHVYKLKKQIGLVKHRDVDFTGQADLSMI